MKGCRPLQKAEVKKFLEQLSIRDKLLVLTGLYFGTRISETLQLKFSDVTGEYINIRSSKNSETVTFSINSEYRKAVQELKRYYEKKSIEVTPETYLFLSRQGGNRPIDRTQANRILARAADSAGLDGNVNSHSCRKTFVTEIYKKSGFNIAETKKYSRHKSLGNLDYYIGTSQDLNLIGTLSW